MCIRGSIQRFWFVALALMLVASACSNAEQDASESSVVTDPVEAFADEDADPDLSTADAPDGLASVTGADQDRDFAIALVRPDSWVPGEASIVDQSAVIMTDLLYDGLTEAAGTSTQLRPALATSWVANDDLSEWTFTLDVDRLDATDVAIDLNTKLNAGGFTASVLLAGVVEIAVLDPETLVLRSDGPNAGLPWRLSGVGASIIGPNGATTGAFSIASDGPDTATLETADWVTSSDLSIEVVWAESASAAYDDLTLGLVEAAVVGEDEITESMDRYGATFAARNVSAVLVMNGRSDTFVSPTARAAVGAAIDRDTLARSYGVSTYPADGIAAPSLAGFRPGTCAIGCVYDPESVSELLGDVAIGTVSVGYVGDERAPSAAVVVDSLATVGIEAEAVGYDTAGLSAALADGTVDLALTGWVAPASSLDGVVPGLFSARSGVNLSGLYDDAIQDLIDEADATKVDSQRWGLLAQAERLGVEAGGVVPIGLLKGTLVVVPGGPNLPVRADGSIDLGGFG